jgi:hypothetical protein
MIKQIDLLDKTFQTVEIFSYKSNDVIQGGEIFLVNKEWESIILYTSVKKLLLKFDRIKGRILFSTL